MSYSELCVVAARTGKHGVLDFCLDTVFDTCPDGELARLVVDVLGLWHLYIIVEVCRRTPHCKQWLATREYGIVKEFAEENEIPKNLNIRLSADLINQDYRHTPIEACTVSTVSTAPRKDAHNCPASFGPFSKRSCELASCRACWDRSVRTVNYRLR